MHKAGDRAAQHTPPMHSHGSKTTHAHLVPKAVLEAAVRVPQLQHTRRVIAASVATVSWRHLGPVPRRHEGVEDGAVPRVPFVQPAGAGSVESDGRPDRQNKGNMELTCIVGVVYCSLS